MNKLKSFLLNVNFSLLAFMAYVTRLIISGASGSDAIALFALGGVYAYTRYLKYDQDRINAAKVELQLQAQTELQKRTERMEQDITELKSAISAVKLGQATWSHQIRKTGSNGP